MIDEKLLDEEVTVTVDFFIFMTMWAFQTTPPVDRESARAWMVQHLSTFIHSDGEQDIWHACLDHSLTGELYGEGRDQA